MIKAFRGVLVMMITFSLSWGMVDLFNRFERGTDEIVPPVVSLIQPLPIIPDEAAEYTQLVDSLREGDFVARGHACGSGFMTGYITVGRKQLSHSFAAFDDMAGARAGFALELRRAKKIIDGPRQVERSGKEVTRYFLRRDEDGRKFFEVIWIERHPKGFTSIAGPDETSTLKLEEYLIEQNSWVR